MNAESQQFERNKEEINRHPLLSLPREDREKDRRLYMEFYSLVLKNLGFLAVIERRAGAGRERNILEEEELRWESSREKIAGTGFSYYDDLAFAEALKKAVNGYEQARSGDAPAASFLTYFNQIYAREVRKESSRLSKTVVNQTKSHDRQLMSKILVMLQKKYGEDYDIDNLPEQVIRSIAQTLEQEPEKLKELLAFYRDFRCPGSLAPEIGDDGEEMESNLADSLAENPFEAVRYSELLLNIMEDICDVDDREYSRLFLTNTLLSGAKEDDAPDSCEFLLKNENFLLARVFVHGYLRFVMVLPEQISARAIILAPLIRALLDATIAEYKGVGPTAVSNRRKQYLARLRLINRKHGLQIMS